MWWGGPVGFVWFLGWIVAVVVALVVLRLVVGRLLGWGGRHRGLWAAGAGRGVWPGGAAPGCGGPGHDAAEILRRRLASGELSEADYARLRELLSR